MKHTKSQLEQAFISHCCDRGVIKFFETVGEVSMGEVSMGEYSKGEYSKGELQFALTKYYQYIILLNS